MVNIVNSKQLKCPHVVATRSQDTAHVECPGTWCLECTQVLFRATELPSSAFFVVVYPYKGVLTSKLYAIVFSGQFFCLTLHHRQLA